MRLTALAAAGLFLAAVAPTVTLAKPPPPPHAAAPTGKLTVDSPIEALMANAATRKVMDKHLPKLAENGHYEMFKDSSLREIAPMSQGKLTDEVLAKINAELAAAQP
jgi:hypothetical protein